MKRLIRETLISVLLFIIFIFLFYWNNFTLNESDYASDIDISYLEDSTGNLSLEDVKNVFSQGGFIEKEDGTFYFGSSSSTFWIRIMADDIEALKDYVAIYNPYLQFATYYVNDQVAYSGWGNYEIKTIESLAYPVFKVNLEAPEAIYIRMSSSYIHDYAIKFFSQKEYIYHRNLDFFVGCILIGIVFTILISNLLIFWRGTSLVCLSFAVSSFFFTLKLADFTGSANLFPSRLSILLMRSAIEKTFVFYITILWFFILISNVRTYSKKYYHVLIGLMMISTIGAGVAFFNPLSVNGLSYLLSFVVIATCHYIGLRIHLSGHQDLRLYLLGWNFLYFISVISILRALGIVFDSFMITLTSISAMVIIYGLFFRGILDYTNQMQVEKIEMEHRYSHATEQMRRAELALLQTQIKPHFLYNILASIEYLCGVDAKRAQRAVADFSEYLRCNIDFSVETGVIHVQREIDTVKHYLALEKMRFDDRLNIVYNIHAADFYLPPLVIQQMVENAVRHGITKKKEGGSLSIELLETPLEYSIVVSDDGVGFDVGHSSDGGRSHIGIENARKRLIELCDGSLTVTSELGKGTTAVIVIPKKKDNRYEDNNSR